jgi:hypothetical protein
MTNYEEAYLFDLDGTLAYTDGKHDDFTKIGEPIPRMISIIKEYIAAGKLVKIFTARYSRRNEHPGIIPAIEEWCEKHIGKKLEITNVKDPGVKELWDDRSVAVCRNVGFNVKYVDDHMEGYFRDAGWLRLISKGTKDAI